MSGSKIIVNQTGSTIQVTIQGRIGDSPGLEGPPVSATIQAGGRATLQYGSDQNPYMDVLQIAAQPAGQVNTLSLRVVQRGGAGTLDAFFNTHSTVTIGYSAQTFSYALSASN